MERPRLGENLKDGYKLKVARENRQNWYMTCMMW